MFVYAFQAFTAVVCLSMSAYASPRPLASLHFYFSEHFGQVSGNLTFSDTSSLFCAIYEYLFNAPNA